MGVSSCVGWVPLILAGLTPMSGQLVGWLALTLLFTVLSYMSEAGVGRTGLTLPHVVSHPPAG